MSTTTHSASVLNSLIETCKDGQDGFRDAAEGVKDSALKTLLSEFSLQRSQFVGELQEAVRELGEEAQKTGSTAAALHRGWIDLKAAITGKDDHAILAECERGEDSAVAAYKDALASSALSANHRATVETQATAVKATHDHVKALRDARAN